MTEKAREVAGPRHTGTDELKIRIAGIVSLAWSQPVSDAATSAAGTARVASLTRAVTAENPFRPVGRASSLSRR